MKYTWVALFILFCLTSFSQDKKAMKYYQDGMYQKGLEKIDEAIALFDLALQEDPSYIDPRFQKALLLKDFKKEYTAAKLEFEFIDKLKPNNYLLPLSKYIGDCYFREKNFVKAKEYYLKYLNTPGVLLSKNKDIDVKIKNCDYSESYGNKVSPIALKNLGDGVNTSGMEYFPSTTADESQLYFTRRKDKTLYSDEDIYVSNSVEGAWQKAKPVNGPINTNSNEGAHHISPSGRYLLFTSCDRPGEFVDARSCDLYISKMIKGEWGKPNNMGAPVNTSGWESQPSIAADGKSLYFVSNRPGGQGGLDIWVSEMDDKGQFGEPFNAGPTINTPYDEEKPFIHPDGNTVYFISNGHPGYGGKDIYKSKRFGKIWLSPVNLGLPINSQDDEMGIFINALGNKAYIASNRPEGKGDMDIYSFDLPLEYQPTPVSFIKGTISDINGKWLGAKGQIIDVETNQVAINFSSDADNGEFLLCLPTGKNYMFNIGKEGYLFYSENFPLKNETGKGVQMNIKLTPISKGQKIQLKNIFFETAQFNLKAESRAELDKMVEFMKTNPTIKIEIGGHTDNVGDEKQNKLLSENRAKAVVDFMISQGIEASRMISKGYGSSMSIADNNTLEGRSKNRRTELIVL